MKVFDTQTSQPTVNNFYQPIHDVFHQYQQHQHEQHISQSTNFPMISSTNNTEIHHTQQGTSPVNFPNHFMSYQNAYFGHNHPQVTSGQTQNSTTDKKPFKVVKNIHKVSSKQNLSQGKTPILSGQFEDTPRRFNQHQTHLSTALLENHQNQILQSLSSQWDINDSKLPKISNFDEFQTWPQGSVCYAYNKTVSEAARRHSSGWAMRNTNNHNSQILKKSCLGVLICTVAGCDLAMRPAICDKARMRQQGRKCPKPNCPGFIKIQRCRGHEGYPVTHFWREINDTVYFQAKGKHDHGRPDIKPVRDTAARRKRQLERNSTTTGEVVKEKMVKSSSSCMEDVQSTWSKSSQLSHESTPTPVQPISQASYQADYFQAEHQQHSDSEAFNLFSSPMKSQNFINNYYNELNNNGNSWSYNNEYNPWLNQQNDFNNNRVYENSSQLSSLTRSPPPIPSNFNNFNSSTTNTSYNNTINNNFQQHGSSSSSPTSSLHLLSSSSFGQISSAGDSSINNLLNTSLNNNNINGNYQFNNSLDFINDNTKVGNIYSSSETSTTSTTHRQSDPCKYSLISSTLDVII